MPVYVPSKTAIIDDVWATSGSANLDGTSMNYHEIGLIITGSLLDRAIEKANLTNDPGKFLWQLFWYLFSSSSNRSCSTSRRAARPALRPQN